MALFLSTFINKRDKKGRVSVPAAFRLALSSKDFAGVVMVRSFIQNCLDGMSMEYMEKISQTVDAIASPIHACDHWGAVLCAEAQPLLFDGEGRITLSDSLVAHAQLKEEVAFVGRGPFFQIWNPHLFEENQKQARTQLLATLSGEAK
jgi:MraZ protein